MRAFILKLLLFLLPVGAVFLCIEILIRKVPNEYETKFRQFEKALPSVQLLILGSSHGLRAFNPHGFDVPAYNMAMVAQQLPMDHDILLRHGERASKLKFVVCSISYFSLSKDLSQGEIYGRLPFYNFYYDLQYAESPIISLDTYSLQSLIGPRESLERIWKYKVRKKYRIDCDSLGWMGSPRETLFGQELLNDAKAAVERHEDGSQAFSTNLALVSNMCRWAETKGVKIFFVATPMSREYNSLLDKNKVDAIKEAMSTLDKNHNNAVFLDLSDDPRFSTEDFSNSDHLNDRGSQKITRIVSQLIEPQ